MGQWAWGLQRGGRLGPGEGAEAAGSTALSRDGEGWGGTLGRRLTGRGGGRHWRGGDVLVQVREVQQGSGAEQRTPGKWSAQLGLTGT